MDEMNQMMKLHNMDEMNKIDHMMKFTTTSWIKLTITCNTIMIPTHLGYQFQ